MSTTELREVQVFLGLTEELHFSHTVERLNLTSSRISQIVRDLERKLGGRLVYRTSRHVELTALGEQFRDEIKGAYDELTTVLARTQKITRHRADALRPGLFPSPLDDELCQSSEISRHDTLSASSR